MSAPQASPDRRTHAFRPDLADLALRDSVKAARYVEPSLKQCIKGVLPLLAEPKPGAKLISEIRYGEFVDVFDISASGYAWVQNRIDRYVGYMPAKDALNEEIADFSNRVTALRTFVYPKPDIKLPPIDELTLSSFVHLGPREGEFYKLASGGYVFAGHIAPAAEALEKDYAFTAGRLLNIPYLWGGRTPKGLDCSGFVQLALEMAGIDCPRDSDQQCEAFGEDLPCHWRDAAWKRGDLVFFEGHVGIMTGPEQMIHANAYAMKVTVEPLFDVVMRGADITAAGRPLSR